ncbi:8200_t:CDS:2 [Funneliformis geosporum]|nr:8200_t:CDS:2 [Funneliformis geosporum]
MTPFIVVTGFYLRITISDMHRYSFVNFSLTQNLGNCYHYLNVYEYMKGHDKECIAGKLTAFNAYVVPLTKRKHYINFISDRGLRKLKICNCAMGKSKSTKFAEIKNGWRSANSANEFYSLSSLPLRNAGSSPESPSKKARVMFL